MQTCLSFVTFFLWVSTIYNVSAQQLNNSHIAFTVSEKDVLPESIAYDSIKDEFYIRSTREGKIIKVAKDGSQVDFFPQGKMSLGRLVVFK